MNKLIVHHPALTHANEVRDICRPLEKLNISYFAHVHIDNDGKFSALTNNPGFTQHYLENEYYNADIHLADKNRFGNHVVWDAIERFGKSAKMHSEAAQFGVQHTFTLIDKNDNGQDYYHFANDSACKSINQIYLANIDLLKMFTLHFNENVAQSAALRHAYEMTFGIDPEAEGYSTQFEDRFVIADHSRKEFLNSISVNENKIAATQFVNQYQSKLTPLTPRERECLHLYVRGHAAREISELLKLSRRTIEHYLESVKMKLGVDTKNALIRMFLEKNHAA